MVHDSIEEKRGSSRVTWIRRKRSAMIQKLRVCKYEDFVWRIKQRTFRSMLVYSKRNTDLYVQIMYRFEKTGTKIDRHHQTVSHLKLTMHEKELFPSQIRNVELSTSMALHSIASSVQQPR